MTDVITEPAHGGPVASHLRGPSQRVRIESHLERCVFIRFRAVDEVSPLSRIITICDTVSVCDY